MGTSVHDAVVTAAGPDGLLRLAHAWHRNCVADPVVNHAFEHSPVHPEHAERLAAYWEESLGGGARFTSEITDHSTVVRMHSGNGPHADMDARALACFVAALDEVGLGADPALARVLTEWFSWAIDRMSDYHDSADDVPDGLPMQQWGWDGPIRG